MSFFSMRQVELSDISENFEQILHKTMVGELPKENLGNFLVLAKKFFERNIDHTEDQKIKEELQQKANRMQELIEQWQYWTNIERLVSESKWQTSSYKNLLRKVERLVKERVTTKNDRLIRFFVSRRGDLYIPYVLNILNLYRKKFLYKILSEIWIVIYGLSMIEDTEITDIVTGLVFDKAKYDLKKQHPEQSMETLPSERRASIPVSERKVVKREIEPTPICLRQILNTMSPYLENLRSTFFKDTDFKIRYYNAESYAFSLSMVSEKVLPKMLVEKLEVDKLKEKALELLSDYGEFKFLSELKKKGSLDLRLENHLLMLEQQINNELLVIFSDCESIRDSISLIGLDKDEALSSEGGPLVIYRKTRDLSEHEKTNLVGFQLYMDTVITYFRELGQGAQKRQVQIKCTPYAINVNELPSLILILGKTGGGKTVHALCYVYALLKGGYTVFDCSMNKDRAGELIFSSLPVDKEEKKLYEKVVYFQQMIPEGIPETVLIPYYQDIALPERLPSFARIVTIPLCMLAHHRYSLPLLFSSSPKNDVRELVDTILTHKADKSWDLETLRDYLTMLDNKGKHPTIEITEVYKFDLGEEKFEVPNSKEIELDKNVIGRALRGLVKTTSIISSGQVSTAIDFDELAHSKTFVIPYYGVISDKSTALAFNKWWVNSVIDYKSEHKDCYITILINEAQEVAPSHALIGGTHGKEKHASTIDWAERVLQLRGMGFHAIINTQASGQIREQFQTQSGLRVLFHTEDDEELKYVFGNLANKELAETLKSVMRSEFALTQHIACIVKGTEDVKVILGAVPPCCLEKQNVDQFTFYFSKKHGDYRNTKEYIQIIQIDKIKRLLKEHPDLLKKTFESKGKTLAFLSADEIVMKLSEKEELEKKQTIPEGIKLIKETELQHMTRLDENEVIVDKNDIEKIEKYRHIIEKLEGVKLFNREIKNKTTFFMDCIADILISCDSEVTFTLKTIDDWAEKIGIDICHMSVWLMFNRKFPKHSYLMKIIEFSKEKSIGRNIAYKTNPYTIKLVRESLGEEYMERCYWECAVKYFEKIPELSWNKGVVECYNDLRKRANAELKPISVQENLEKIS